MSVSLAGVGVIERLLLMHNSDEGSSRGDTVERKRRQSTNRLLRTVYARRARERSASQCARCNRSPVTGGGSAVGRASARARALSICVREKSM